jgi:hypothetical protein
LKTASTETDPSQPSPVLQQLVECLKYLISQNENQTKPNLILAGDILELALTETNQAAMAFERFMELIMPPGNELFEKIIYIPGNHDHHLWESGRETQYSEYMKTLAPGTDLPIPWHATNIFVENDPKPLPCYFLTRLVQRFPHLKDFVITMAYPNFGLFKDGKQQCVIFHHGHFIEPIYQLMSTLRNLIFSDRKKPKHIWDIEAENFAWIDFFWSTMGRSGEIGADIELIYEKMGDREQFKRLLYPLVDNLVRKYGLLAVPKFIQTFFLKMYLRKKIDKMAGLERAQVGRPLSQEAEKGLREYMEGLLKEQILKEDKGSLLQDVTFVFGHTHKPFQEDMYFNGYPNLVNLYNTGGWVVESVEPQGIHGGAVILVDEELNIVSLRMYNEQQKPGEYLVRVEEATHASEGGNSFYSRIQELVKASEEPWQSFSHAIARAVHVRAQALRNRINR